MRSAAILGRFCRTPPVYWGYKKERVIQMGHQVPTPLVPLAQRIGCGHPHKVYDPQVFCIACHVINGGSDD